MICRQKVLHIITRLDPGGSATNTLETVARLDPLRYEVHLLSGRTCDATGDAEAFIRRHRINAVFLDDLVREVHPWLDLVALVKLTGFIRRGKYDIVHTHSSKAGFLGRIAARFAGVRHVVHTPHGHVFYGYFSAPATRLFMWLERVAAPLTDRLVALTPTGIEEHLRVRVGARTQWVAIPSGVDLEALRVAPGARGLVRREFGVADQEVLFITVSRLEPVKGNEHVIESFAAVARAGIPARLMFVGDGAERERLEQLVLDRGLGGKVIFAGFRKDVALFLAAADVFVLGSLNEGMGRAAVEALAAGLPCVVTRAGGLADVVSDGKEGFLVPPADSMMMGQCMRRLAADPALRTTMAAASREKAGHVFSIQTMVKRIDRLYQQITGVCIEEPCP
jgi:glycosyltransferase involved in cell wall biosynthesis